MSASQVLKSVLKSASNCDNSSRSNEFLVRGGEDELKGEIELDCIEILVRSQCAVNCFIFRV